MDDPRPVALLPPEVSRRIAAGEVIERPASVVRELIDNSLDAGATQLDLSWDAGGAELIRVTDDGRGMTREDLDLAWHPHATSKIRTVEDLEHARCLGFRGEALASVAAVSELEIKSAVPGSTSGNRLLVRHAEPIALEPAPPVTGTTVQVRRLFANLPARRRFLSRPQAETQAIRNTIADKALPFPEVRFSHQTGSTGPRVLPSQSQLERVAALYGPKVPPQSLREVSGSGEGFSVHLVAAEPAIVRRDRRLIQVFVNRRRVWEYRLVQAVEYAYQDVQHGGLFPAAAVLIDVDPALADFNIHPAKREVRLRNAGEIHHRVVEVLRGFLRAWTVRTVTLDRDLWPDRPRRSPPGPTPAPPTTPPEPLHTPQSVRDRPGSSFTPTDPAARRDTSPRSGDPGWRRSAHFDHETRAIPGPDDLVYRGTLFGTYLVVERGTRAWIIDQHAAHERLLYDRFAAARSSQRLLVPEEFEVSEDQDRMLRDHAAKYGAIGIQLERVAVGRWQLEAIPVEYCENTEDMIETILELQGLEDALDRRFLAEMACKAALKAGDYLDGITAVELAERTLALDEPRCPHGRPLFVEVTADGLARLIGRK